MEEITAVLNGVELTLKEGDPRVFLRNIEAFALEKGLDYRFVIPLRLFPQKNYYAGTPEGRLVQMYPPEDIERRDLVCISCNYHEAHNLPYFMKSNTVYCPGCGAVGCVIYLPDV